MEDKIWKVSDVNFAIKEIIEGGFGPFWLEGEIGTITIHRSGHVYMILKDENSQIKAVYWRGSSNVRKLSIESGTKVEVFGRLTVYEVRGEYQFSIKSIRTVGLGELQRKFEYIKEKLNREGLFDQERKKKIPLLPRVIGIVTSPSGAAIRDFLKIVNRRFPNIHIKIYPASVQGDGAEKEVANGIKFFNEKGDVDVIVITRGGGSMEDLWAFNDEDLARTIASSSIPVISAIGHEIDFTISDFVADLRVPTPSAAAELVVGHQEELKRRSIDLYKRMRNSIELSIERVKRRYDRAANSYIFRDPLRFIYEKEQRLDELSIRIVTSMDNMLNRVKRKLDVIDGKLSTLNPRSVLNRGYSILIDKRDNSIIKAPVDKGIEVKAMLKTGDMSLIVK